MIGIASRTTNGVKIPGRKQTRGEIIGMFNSKIQSLGNHLNVSIFFRLMVTHYSLRRQSPAVPGLVSLTLDAWQVSNVDIYQAVTGSWVEVVSPKEYKVQSALLGFTRLNASHNGQALGRALYKVVSQVGIAHKVCSLLLTL